MSIGVGARSNMTYPQQKTLSGAAIGAGAGAAVGALTDDRQVHVGQ